MVKSMGNQGNIGKQCQETKQTQPTDLGRVDEAPQNARMQSEGIQEEPTYVNNIAKERPWAATGIQYYVPEGREPFKLTSQARVEEAKNP